ncbi:transcription initiation at TATA-containing promoter protein [Marasmius crinis-equi]|uniref:Transcription initiation at TATA-containing promoter protein n=1 Tax=Marasmius crinis-equi TaxID=585013 RepID=A0ABR3FI60_9AGAR
MSDRVEPTEPIVNGVDKPNGIHLLDSPVDVLAHHEIQEPESNVRSEPLKPIVVTDNGKDASVVLQVDSTLETKPISTDPPTDPVTPFEETADNNEQAPDETHHGVNGSGPNGVDVVMGDNDEHTPATTPAVSTSTTMESVGSSTAHTTPNEGPDDEEEKPPPAKRARVYSDADKASLTHSASPPPQSTTTSTVTTPVPAGTENATPPPPSTADNTEFTTTDGAPEPSTTSTAAPISSESSTLSVSQWRFCQSTIRTLKKMKDAAPFLRPVDPVALNIPHYPSIVKIPMDFSTVERKLTASNPGKPDNNPANPRYFSADDFITDVRLIFNNCYTFNGPDHVVSAMGKRVEEVFDKQIKNLPPAETVKPPVVKKQSPPPRPVAVPPPPPPTKKVPNRRASTSVPVIRRSDAQADAVGRPKREIHPPPPKDLAYADPPKKPRKSKLPKDDGTAEQLKYCGKILDYLHKKNHASVASPFYEPVDWVKLEIPSYPKIIKKPMDLGTMRRKLDNNEYLNAQKFWDDFKLMIRNCFTFNPAGTPVNQAGQELQRLFDEKWKGLPIPSQASDDEEEEEEETSQDERDRAIVMMEQQIESMQRNISALKGKTKEKKKKEKKEKPPVPSTSKAPPKPPKATSSKGKKPKAKVADDDVLSFEQKKDLSEAIATLEGTKLEKVIQIIHEGVPEIRDSTEEIELEIDTLPAPVLTKLYNFVIRPMKPPPPKRNRPGKGTGTGGLKRKSMDEDVEAAKIRQLEERMALFEQKAGGASSAAQHHQGGHSSDSSSDSDSSGSDSE